MATALATKTDSTFDSTVSGLQHHVRRAGSSPRSSLSDVAESLIEFLNIVAASAFVKLNGESVVSLNLKEINKSRLESQLRLMAYGSFISNNVPEVKECVSMIA